MKETLTQIQSIRRELQDLDERLNKSEEIRKTTYTDSVQASSKEYPYIQHNCVISGVDYNKYKKYRNLYKKQIKNKEFKLVKLINSLEYKLNYVEDSEIRRLIRYKYEDNLNWIQIMHKMKYNTEDTARKKIKRFLKKVGN